MAPTSATLGAAASSAARPRHPRADGPLISNWTEPEGRLRNDCQREQYDPAPRTRQIHLDLPEGDVYFDFAELNITKELDGREDEVHQALFARCSMMKTIVASAILGAAGGVLGGLLETWFSKLFAKSKERAHSGYGVIVGVVVTLSIPNGMGLRSKLADLIFPPSPMETLGRRLFEIPGVKAKITNMPAEEAQTTMRQLSAAGMLKLESSHLTTRVRLVGEMLETADESRCGRFAKGAVSAADFEAMMAPLSTERQVEWFELTKAAVEAEIGDVRAPPEPTESEIARAMASVTQQVSEVDRPRFAKNLGSMAELNQRDACWTAKTLYEAVAKTPEPAQSVVARALLMP